MHQSKSLGALVGSTCSKSVGDSFSKSLNRLSHSSSVHLPSEAEHKVYPTDPSQYEILEDCGKGVSATVYLAMCRKYNEPVAIKAFNLDALATPIEDLVKEASIMKAYKHPNVLPLHCAFVTDAELWMVMPYCEGGSVAHMLRYAHPDGLDEHLIAAIMKQALKGLEYVHRHEGIHRDVKSGNLLLDAEGHCKLADFGVSATLERGGEWGQDICRRNTFAGTPCWMAPEVLEQSSGYSSSADIWSFGITLLEVAHGHAPFAKMPPMKVLLMTLQGPPPQLEERCGQRTFSRGMREVVALCLSKDPSKRPSASELLEHRFFKRAKDASYVKKHLLEGLPPLPQRVMEIRAGKAATSAKESRLQSAKSMVRYASDVAQWDFTCATGHALGSEGDAASAAAAASIAGANGAAAQLEGEGCTNGKPAATLAPVREVAEIFAHGDRLGVLSGPSTAATSPRSSPDTSRAPSPEQQQAAPSPFAAASAAAFAAPSARERGRRASDSSVAAPSKRTGRFTVYEGSQPYQGPEAAELDAGRTSPQLPDQQQPSPPLQQPQLQKQLSPGTAARQQRSLMRLRSISSPLLIPPLEQPEDAPAAATQQPGVHAAASVAAPAAAAPASDTGAATSPHAVLSAASVARVPSGILSTSLSRPSANGSARSVHFIDKPAEGPSGVTSGAPPAPPAAAAPPEPERRVSNDIAGADLGQKGDQADAGAAPGTAADAARDSHAAAAQAQKLQQQLRQQPGPEEEVVVAPAVRSKGRFKITEA